MLQPGLPDIIANLRFVKAPPNVFSIDFSFFSSSCFGKATANRGRWLYFSSEMLRNADSWLMSDLSTNSSILDLSANMGVNPLSFEANGLPL